MQLSRVTEDRPVGAACPLPTHLCSLLGGQDDTLLGLSCLACGRTGPRTPWGCLHCTDQCFICEISSSPGRNPTVELTGSPTTDDLTLEYFTSSKMVQNASELDLGASYHFLTQFTKNEGLSRPWLTTLAARWDHPGTFAIC